MRPGFWPRQKCQGPHGKLRAVNSRDTGFVYAMVNPTMPNIIKIGFTTLLPEDRARDLSSGSGVPAPFALAFRALTMRWRAVERLIHRRLDGGRVSPRREFFSVSLEKAIETVREAILDVNGIHAWDRSLLPRPHLISRSERIALALGAGDIFVLLTHPTPQALVGGSGWQPFDVWQVHAEGDQLEIFAASGEHETAGLSDHDAFGDEDPVPYLDRDKKVANGVLIGKERLTPGDRLLWMADSGNAAIECTSTLFEAQEHCQVACRTWTPQSTTDGHPLLLNVLARNPSPSMVATTQHAISLPGPRQWGPRTGALPASPMAITPERWLPQLRPRNRR